MIEEWKFIDGTDNDYMVSSLGRVKSLKAVSERILKPRITHDGYVWYNLCINGKQLNKRAHRLVAIAFIPNPHNKPTVNHIDGDKLNNSVSNLEWSTLEEQMQHAYKNHLKKPVQGILQGNSVLTEEQVREIRNVYKRRSKEFGMLALAEKYGVSLSTINKCIGNRSYKNVK